MIGEVSGRWGSIRDVTTLDHLRACPTLITLQDDHPAWTDQDVQALAGT